MKGFRTLLIATTLILGACGGSSSSSGGGETSSTTGSTDNGIPDYRASGFDIEGTSADTGTGAAPINPGVSGGNFVAKWTVDGPGTLYAASMAVSTNDTLSGSDVEFYSQFCGGANLECGESDHPLAYDCYFNGSNEIWCSGHEGEKQDLTSALGTLPADAYIILETCDASFLNCETVAHQVQFQ